MKRLVLLLAISGCASPGGFTCDVDVPNQCVHQNGSYAVCIPATDRCAVPDMNCASGYRYDVNAGKLAGQCVPTTVMIPPAPPDMAIERDMASLDMTAAIDMATPDLSAIPVDMAESIPDMTTPPDMTFIQHDMTGSIPIIDMAKSPPDLAGYETVGKGGVCKVSDQCVGWSTEQTLCVYGSYAWTSDTNAYQCVGRTMGVTVNGNQYCVDLKMTGADPNSGCGYATYCQSTIFTQSDLTGKTVTFPCKGTNFTFTIE